VVVDIESWISPLLLLAKYLILHETYFVLADREWILVRDYTQELNAINTYKYDQATLMTVLHQIVYNKRYSHYVDSSYPYIAYVNQLQHDLAALKRCKSNCAFYYAQRMGFVDSLILNLEWMRAAFDPYYRSEILQKQHYELQQQRIAMEAERIRLQAAWEIEKWKQRERELQLRMEELEHERAAVNSQIIVSIDLR
jgi:hypothetical protein